MAEYIEREMLKKQLMLESSLGYIKTLEDVEKIIDFMTAADVAPVVHGKWENIFEYSLYCPDIKATIELTEQKCSNCRVITSFKGAKPYLPDNTCPYCGADMRGNRDE